MKRPNILIIYTDQQRWDAVGVNGNSEIITPNLDRLARQGTNFDHCFVQNPVCMPSRVSFLTGQYPSQLGITHMAVPVPRDTVTLPRLLKPYGYRSANIGKLHFLPHANRDHRVPHPDYGFDHLEICDEPGVYQDAYRAWVERQAPDQLDHLSVGLPPATDAWYKVMGRADPVKHPAEGGRHDFRGPIPFPGRAEFTHSSFVAEQTIAFLTQQDGRRPFLCIAGFFSPHAPWVVPQRYLDMYDPATFSLPDYPPALTAQQAAIPSCSDARRRAAKHGYYAMVSEVDDHVGRILDQLDAQGLADDTIVVFTSDHGEWLGDHMLFGKGYPGDDAVSRVPLIIRWPAEDVSRGKTVSEIVEAVGVVPTLLTCAGIQIPPHIQGHGLASALRGAEFDGSGSALLEAAGWKSLRTPGYRYVIRGDGEEHLWDLTRDPVGDEDVAGDPRYAVELAQQRLFLLQRILKIERPGMRVWPY